MTRLTKLIRARVLIAFVHGYGMREIARKAKLTMDQVEQIIREALKGKA
jgi:hypothetical protein